METTLIRPAALAGSWYPGYPAELRLTIESWLSGARRKSAPSGEPSGERSAAHAESPRLLGLILPHAGHRYSGPTLAAGIARITAARVSRVIMIGPAHRARVRGAVLSAASHFETPLGRVPVDRAAIQRLAAAAEFSVSNGPHATEHCLEIILPFLQAVIPSFTIVPALVGTMPDADRIAIAVALRGILDDRTLLVISSDFVHYGDDFGYTPDVGRDPRLGVRKIDEAAIEHISRMDAAGLLAFQRECGATICGIQPIAAALDALPEKSRVEQIHYSQSADVSGDIDHMVSYAAIAIYEP